MNDNPDVRPVFDYEKMPWLSRTGVQMPGNNNYATRSLFLETAPDPSTALWCLTEHEVFAHGKWYPSAWMVYIHAEDEYDALMKICGHVKQWEHIKGMHCPNKNGKLFEDVYLPLWQTEQAYMQRSKLKRTLTVGALSGGPGYTAAAKMLLQMIDAPARGRPKKEKAPPKATEIAPDADRILTFRS